MGWMAEFDEEEQLVGVLTEALPPLLTADNVDGNASWEDGVDKVEHCLMLLEERGVDGATGRAGAEV